MGSHVVCGVFIVLQIAQITRAYSGQQKKVCFGDKVNISCEKKEELHVFEAFYQRIPEGSAECENVSKEKSRCNVPHLASFVRDKCNGQKECLLDHTKEVKPSDAIKCQRVMYLKILYRCESRQNQKGSRLRRFDNDNVTHLNKPPSVGNVSTNVKEDTTLIPKVANDQNVTPSTGTGAVAELEYSLHMQVLLTFVELRLFFHQIGRTPKKFVLCVTLSMAAGIFILILYFLLLFWCKKCRRNRRKMMIDERRAEISMPLIVTTPSTRHETTPTQNGSTTQTSLTDVTSATLPRTASVNSKNIGGTLTLRRGSSLNHQVISTIRRSHSIDECTQTDLDETDDSNRKRESLSEEQVQELGFLVDVMKVYNNKLEDEFSSETLRRGNKEQNRTYNDNSVDDPDFYFTKTLNSFPSQQKSTRPKLKKQISFHSTENSRYFGDEELSSSDEKFKTLPSHYGQMQRNTSQVSSKAYASSFGSNDIDFFSPESIFNGDTLKYNSIARTPKLGVRGDGYDVIMGEPPTSSK